MLKIENEQTMASRQIAHVPTPQKANTRSRQTDGQQVGKHDEKKAADKRVSNARRAAQGSYANPFVTH